jgi:hypothetical protein
VLVERRLTVTVRSSGEVVARVQGPVKANDPVGQVVLASNQAGRLAAGGQTTVGQVLADIAGAVVKLILVRLGAGGGAGGFRASVPDPGGR